MANKKGHRMSRGWGRVQKAGIGEMSGWKGRRCEATIYRSVGSLRIAPGDYALRQMVFERKEEEKNATEFTSHLWSAL